MLLIGRKLVANKRLRPRFGR